MKNPHRKYGLTTAISMVVGGVIGSGVFFKTESINRITDGNLLFSVIAWGIGALVMILCLMAFSEITAKGADGGLYTITKKLSGKKYSYFVGFFTATVYYPSLASILSYLAARYTLLTTGNNGGVFCAVLSAFILAAAFLQNAFLPAFSGKVQIVTTVLKLIPLVFMIALGIPKGELPSNIANESSASFKEVFFPSVTATLFAYEGWISLTSAGKNLKSSRKNLPLALMIGGAIISAVYILYYLGIMGAVSSKILTNYGADGIKIAFSNISGKWGGLLTVFVAISCYGALNALVMGCGNSVGEIFGKKPEKAYLAGFLISLLWLLYLVGEQGGFAGKFRFDSTELPVVTIYALYIPIFFSFAKKEKKLKTKAVCAGGIAASLFAVICGIIAHLGEIISYGMILFSIALLSSVFYKETE